MRRCSACWKRMLLVGSLAAGILLPGCGGTEQYYPVPSWPAYAVSGQAGTVGSEAAQPGTAPVNTAQAQNAKPEEGAAPAAPADRELKSSEIASCSNEILTKINEVRGKEGKSALQPDTNLNRAAQARVEQFANAQKKELYKLLEPFGFSAGYSAEVEAVGSVNAETLVSNWMKTGAQRSLLDLGNKQFDKIGIGYTYQNGKSYWTILLTNTNYRYF